jgi:hypothetical protein
VVARWEKLKSRIAHLMSEMTDPMGLTLLLDAAGTTVHDMPLPSLLLRMPLDAVKAKRDSAKLRAASRKTAADPAVIATIGKAGSPIEYLDAPEFQAYWDADAKVMAIEHADFDGVERLAARHLAGRPCDRAARDLGRCDRGPGRRRHLRSQRTGFVPGRLADARLPK